MNSTSKALLWILLGFPVLFLFFAWITTNWLLFYYSIPIAIVVSYLGYYVSKKQKTKS